MEQFVRHTTIPSDNVLVFCDNSIDKSVPFDRCQRIFLPLGANGMQGILYDCLGLLVAILMRRNVLLLGCNAAFLIPLVRLSGLEVYTNIAGLEWSRNKWGKAAQWYLKTMEAVAARFSNTLITDNQKLTNYLSDEYGTNSTLIPYGGDHLVNLPAPTDSQIAPYKSAIEFGKDAYLVVARCQPDNNFETIAESFKASGKPLLIVSNLDNSYGDFLKDTYRDVNNIQFQNGIYDQAVLKLLRDGCRGYIHGHSAGGTNPSLVEAMFSDRPIFCYDNGFNNFTTHNAAFYWTDADDLENLIETFEAGTTETFPQFIEIAETLYTWRGVCEKYEQVFK